MENKELKHVGVLGMKWGKRTARDNSEGALRDVRRIYGNKGSGKNPKKMTDKEIDDEITRVSSGPQSAKVLKRIEKANAKLAKKNREDAIIEMQLAQRAKNAQELKKEFVKQAVEAGARRGKKVDAIKEEQYWDSFFKEELTNTTADSYRAERNKAIARGVALTVGIVGAVVLKNIVVNTAIKKAAGY